MKFVRLFAVGEVGGGMWISNLSCGITWIGFVGGGAVTTFAFIFVDWMLARVE